MIGYLVDAMSTFVGRILISLGIGYASYTGFDTLIAGVASDVLAKIDALGPNVRQFIGILQVGTCVSIIMSALTIKLTLMGLKSNVLTRFVMQ